MGKPLDIPRCDDCGTNAAAVRYGERFEPRILALCLDCLEKRMKGLTNTRLKLDIKAADAASIRFNAEAERVEITAAQSEEGKPALKRFSGLAYTGAAMELDGFYRPVVVDLAGMSAPRSDIPVLKQHDPERIVGHTDAIDLTERRLKIGGVVSGTGDAAQEVLATAANQFPWQLSIGATADSREFVDAGQKVKVNGRSFDGPVVVIRKSTLREVSFVPLGADGATSASVSAEQRNGSFNMEFEKWLEGKGFGGMTLTDKQRETLKAQYDAEQKPAEKDRDVDAILAAAREKEARKKARAKLVQASLDEGLGLEEAQRISALAAEGDWSERDTELALLRATRPNVNVTRSRPAPQLAGSVVEAAICVAGGLKGADKMFDTQTLDMAHKTFRGGIGLQEIILLSARRNGFRDSAIRAGNLAEALRAAFTPDVRADVGPSTYDLSGIMSNVANKFLRAGFESVEAAWQQVTAVRNVRDFKQITSYSLTGDNTYVLVPPGGEIQHGTLGETTYTNRADTYGKMLGLDRRDIINDDLGALTGASRRLGRGGALKLNDVFWTEFLDDSAFFPTDGSLGNYDEGNDTVLALAGLDLANALIRKQTDPDGKPLGLMARILLVPVDLESTAVTLMNSTLLNLVSATTATTGQSNPYMGKYIPVASAYLSAASTTAWYLLANPDDMPVIETCFLNGVQMPTVETADLDFNRLGVALRGYFDFGVKKQEYRGGVKMKGTT